MKAAYFLFLISSMLGICAKGQQLYIYPKPDISIQKYGLADSSGNWVITPQFTSLQKLNTYFYYGGTDNLGKYVYRYDEITNRLIRINYLLPDYTLYRDYLVIIQSFPKGPKGVMNINGKEILPTFYSNIWIKENYILGELNNEMTIYNLEGQKVFPETFKYAEVQNGFIYVKTEDQRFPHKERSVVYNDTLIPITKNDWTIIGKFGKDHLLLVKTLRNELFYINESGRIQIPNNKQLTYEAPFSNGYALVSSQKTPKKYGFINTSGKIVIPLEYDDAGPFQKKYAFIEKQENGKLVQGLIDSLNNRVKIFPASVTNRSVYYDGNEVTYYLSNLETYDADGNYKEDKNLIK